MKSEKGITLISLILYVILLIAVVSMLSIISEFFFTNTKYLTNNSENITEYNKFNMYFIEDVKKNKTAEIEEDNIRFEDGTLYTYVRSDNGIYRNEVKICNNIGYCVFSEKNTTIRNTEKQIINVYMIIKSQYLFETDNNYVLKYW